MKIYKRVLAGSLALAMVFPLAACKNDEEEQSRSDAVTISLPPDTSDGDEESAYPISALSDDARKTIYWMSDADLNPALGKDRSVALTLFEDYCGGKISYIQTSYDKKFDDLAASILGDSNRPDIFPYHWMAFPSQVSKGMYQPVTDIIDFNSPLWSGVKDTADQFVLDNEFYVAPYNIEASALLVYNKDSIDEIGADDPYELYQNGNWNWNTWESIMTKWVDTSTEETKRYGFNGYFATQIVQQTGKTMVTLEDGVFVNNTKDPDIERAETFIYNLAKNGLCYDTWIGSASSAFQQNCLFYSMGEWALSGNNGPGEEDNWGIVPIPADPNTSEKYTTGDIKAYMWVKGSDADEAVQQWFNCSRLAVTDEQYVAADREKFFVANPYWTDEMYQVKLDVVSPEYTLLFDYGYGISPKMGDDETDEKKMSVVKRLYTLVVSTNEETESQYTWSQVRDTYSPVVDAELAELNAAISSMLA